LAIHFHTPLAPSLGTASAVLLSTGPRLRHALAQVPFFAVMKKGERSLTELWIARDERVKAKLMACEEARRAVEKAWAQGAEAAPAAEARLNEAKQQLEEERLRPAHFRCFRRKPGDAGVFQEVDLACEEDQVALSQVVLSSEPCLPPGSRSSAVSIWPNAMVG
jgi:hypothetical protein